METVVSVFVLKILKALDWNSFFVFYRIALTCQNHTYCCIVFKLQIYLIKSTINAGFHHLNDIIFHSGQYHLGFRISESGIIFQYLWPILCKHKAKENNAFKFPAFFCHSIYSCLINIFSAECIYFICIKRTW